MLFRSKQIASCIGYDTFESCPLKPRVTEEKQLDGYRRQRVEIQTERLVTMTFYVLIPDGYTASRHRKSIPAVICPHGHTSAGKYATAGVRDANPDMGRIIDMYRYDYGVQFARAGFIAVCPDARGFGERQEREAAKAGPFVQSCNYLNHMAYPLGRTVTGMWTWDLTRLIDYLETRPEIDPDRIGAAGLSGGGHQVLWLAALDSRIKASVVSGYFYGYKQSLLEMYTNCSCNYVPHLYEYVDMGDIAALIAPRPLFIETGDQDDLNGRDGVKNAASQVKIAAKAYRVLGAAKNIENDIFAEIGRAHV